MDAHQLVARGNGFRESRQPESALACYIQAIAVDHANAHAWNNYGNVIREMGYPDRAIPFLEQAQILDPASVTTKFNLAVSYLLAGDYERGWPAYESRWQYEHLSGVFPAWPRLWRGEDIQDKTLLLWGEQGLGDCIQFLRFIRDLRTRGARVSVQAPRAVLPLLGGDMIYQVTELGSDPGDYDYWSPMMSVPGHLGITLDNLESPARYIEADPRSTDIWSVHLGAKRQPRVGMSWSGRRDSWINQHKSLGFDHVQRMIQQNPQVEWINLQIDAADHELECLRSLGVRSLLDPTHSLADTAALIANLDLVISVDTAVSHLAAAMGCATWIMLNHYAVDWRWLLERGDSPWYPTARLFRQPGQDQWQPVTDQITRYLQQFKI